MKTINLTCFFRLRKPNTGKRLALDSVLSEYTQGAVTYLAWCQENLDYLRTAGKATIKYKNGSTSEKYTAKSLAAIMPKASTIKIAVSSKVQDALLADCSAMLAGYIESSASDPKTKFPTAFRLVEDERLLALHEMRTLADNLEAENELRSALTRKPKATVRPAYFCRSSDFRILTNETLDHWYVWLNALSGKNVFDISATCDGTLIDINTAERFYYTGKCGLLLPIELGLRNDDWHWQFTDYLLPVLSNAISTNEPDGIDALIAEVDHYKTDKRANIKAARLLRTPDGDYELAVAFEFLCPDNYVPETYLGVARDTLWDLSYALTDAKGKVLDVVTEKTGVASLQISASETIQHKQRQGKSVDFRDYRGKQIDELLHKMANRLIAAAKQNQAMLVCESTDKIMGAQKKEYKRPLRLQFEKLVKILDYKCKLAGVPLRTEVFGANSRKVCAACGNLAEVDNESHLTVCLCGSRRPEKETKAINIARRVLYQKAAWENKGGYLAFHKKVAR